MKVPLFIFAIFIGYVLGNDDKYTAKYPKKVRPYGTGKILINAAKYEYKARSQKQTTGGNSPTPKKTYTVFQVVGVPKILGVSDSPYFSIDQAFDQKSRVKKILPDYAWSVGRVKREAVNENINKTTTDNSTKVEGKSTLLPTTKKPAKEESPSMRSSPDKTEDVKEVKKETAKAKAETKIDKPIEDKSNVTKTQKKSDSKTSKKDEPKTLQKDETKNDKKADGAVEDIKDLDKSNILRSQSKIKPPTKGKAKHTDAKAERKTKAKPKNDTDATTGKAKSGTLKQRRSKLRAKKSVGANKVKTNGTYAKGGATKNKKKSNKRKGAKRSKTRGKGKKKNAKSKSSNATRTGAKIPKAHRRLIAAREAVIEDYPYVASIQKDEQHWCTGALLNPRLVITTANCLWKANRISRMEVRVGSRYVDRGGQRAAIQEVMKHPGWGLRKSPDNDVALLLLDRNIKFSDSVHGIDLPNRVMLPPFDDAWVTSWGSERRDGVYDVDSQTLQVYHTRVIDHEKCNNVTMRFSVIVSENFICLAQSGRSGPCTRDTGAPAVSDGILWGLASWGIRKMCGTERFPSMFSYLASHSNLDFIANATRFLMADKRYYPFVDRYPSLN